MNRFGIRYRFDKFIIESRIDHEIIGVNKAECFMFVYFVIEKIGVVLRTCL